MQTIHLQYKDDDSTYMLNNLLSGILLSGVYRGYDLTGVNGRILQLTGNSYEVTEAGGEETKVSVLKTPQGCIVKETEAVQVTLQPNNSSSERVDLIYCEHKFVNVKGGTEAVYKVRSGTVDKWPSLTDRRTQVAIAYVTVPAGWTGGMTTLTYAKVNPPRFAGDPSIVRSTDYNSFKKEQTFIGTRKIMAKCTVKDGIMTSDNKEYDLYAFGSDEETSPVNVVSFDGLGSGVGKIFHIVLATPCNFSNTGKIYTPNNAVYYANKGDVISVLDTTGSPVVSGYRWFIIASQSLKRDSKGQYILDNNTQIGGMLKAKYRLFDGMKSYSTSLSGWDTNIDARLYDLLELEGNAGQSTSIVLLGLQDLHAGKELTIINKTGYSVSLTDAGYNGGSDENPEKKDIVIAKNSVAVIVLTSAHLFVKKSEMSFMG